MFKTTIATTSSATNIRRSIRAGNNGVDDGAKIGKIGGNLSKEENMSNVNPSEMRFLYP